jgi:CSLREA domain-containing protein
MGIPMAVPRTTLRGTWGTLTVLAAAALALALLAAQPPGVAQALTFTVNSLGDGEDAAPGDGNCETAVDNAECTLRAAIQEANQLASEDSITFAPALDGQTITLGSTLPSITDAAGLTIDGGGTVTISGGDTDATDGVRISSWTRARRSRCAG